MQLDRTRHGAAFICTCEYINWETGVCQMHVIGRPRFAERIECRANEFIVSGALFGTWGSGVRARIARRAADARLRAPTVPRPRSIFILQHCASDTLMCICRGVWFCGCTAAQVVSLDKKDIRAAKARQAKRWKRTLAKREAMVRNKALAVQFSERAEILRQMSSSAPLFNRNGTAPPGRLISMTDFVELLLTTKTSDTTNALATRLEDGGPHSRTVAPGSGMAVMDMGVAMHEKTLSTLVKAGVLPPPAPVTPLVSESAPTTNLKRARMPLSRSNPTPSTPGAIPAHGLKRLKGAIAAAPSPSPSPSPSLSPSPSPSPSPGASPASLPRTPTEPSVSKPSAASPTTTARPPPPAPPAPAPVPASVQPPVGKPSGASSTRATDKAKAPIPSFRPSFMQSFGGARPGILAKGLDYSPDHPAPPSSMGYGSRAGGWEGGLPGSHERRTGYNHGIEVKKEFDDERQQDAHDHSYYGYYGHHRWGGSFAYNGANAPYYWGEGCADRTAHPMELLRLRPSHSHLGGATIASMMRGAGGDDSFVDRGDHEHHDSDDDSDGGRIATGTV